MVLALVALSATHASAQGTCPAGRSSDGACVNPALLDSLRETSMILSQPKISSTHYPLLPSEDWTTRYPNQLTGGPQQISPLGRAPTH
jgi:hypothetical protein